MLHAKSTGGPSPSAYMGAEAVQLTPTAVAAEYRRHVRRKRLTFDTPRILVLDLQYTVELASIDLNP